MKYQHSLILNKGGHRYRQLCPVLTYAVQVVFTNAHQEPLETVGTEDVTQRKSYMYSDRLGRASAAILKNANCKTKFSAHKTHIRKTKKTIEHVVTRAIQFLPMDTPGGRRQCSPTQPPLQRTLPLPPLRNRTVARVDLPPIAMIVRRRNARKVHHVGTDFFL